MNAQIMTVKSRFYTLLRHFRSWRYQRYIAKIDHAAVLQHMREDGRLTSHFSFMVTMSCAIAVLGLLLSSPAVVIGAMLISPLMAPIMSLGFSLCILDFRQMKRALEGLVVGVLMALAISFLIVKMSPLTEATPEILARTQPNLFDLLVAIFSGLAGGYAVIKRKGEGIVGVAIATALMPPLAVAGFGLATESMPIAKGALMLFMTNLLAIALSVTILAKWYGFGSNYSRKGTVWQMALIVMVFAGLSLPLGGALKDITYQTYMTKSIRSTIKEYFGNDTSRISIFNIKFSKADGINVDAVVLTPKYKSKAKSQLEEQLKDLAKSDITLSIEQVVLAKEEIKEATIIAEPDKNILTAPTVTQTVAVSKTDEMIASIKQASFFPVRFIDVNVEAKIATVNPEQSKGLSIEVMKQFEDTLSARYPAWTMKVVPPVQALPHIPFDTGSSLISDAAKAKIYDVVWALKRWQTKKVEVIGFASSVGESGNYNNKALAYNRAKSVLTILEERGIAAEVKTEYDSRKQRLAERHQGVDSFRRVEVRLTQMPELEGSEDAALPKEKPKTKASVATPKVASIVVEKK